MNYYLLTFNEDWADEHNVPALDCKTEEEYNKWLESPTGEVNDNYEEELKSYEQNLKASELFKKQLIEKGLWSKPKINYTKEEKEWYEENKVPLVYVHSKPVKVHSNIYPFLGNGGDGFGANFSDCPYNKDLVEGNIVNVFLVNEDFYNIFHKAKLSNLSLSNIFYNENY